MEKVKGFGGFFFRARNPQALKEWYATMLGIAPENGQPAWQQEAGMTVFETFPADTDYFGRAEQGFMLNFRVANLDAMLEQLQQAGVRIDENRQDESYGRFAWIYDPEDNKIELWEPR
jgi:predicted enzyme related to lactoylglutathione lyase